MWPFKKKAKKVEAGETLKSNVSDFWRWFGERADQFYQTIENKACGDLTDEVSEAVDRWLPGMGWVFGPGKDNIGHSFTLTGEGVLARQFVAGYWLSRAPELKGWTFYSSRQPSRKQGSFTIIIDGDNFDSSELWISTYIDEQDEEIDIMAWHPLFAKMEEKESFTVLFLLLDEVLGEFGTSNWIGEIKIGDTRLKEAVPIKELRELVQATAAAREWKKFDPPQCFSLYETKTQEEGGLRSDIFVGTTRFFDLVARFPNPEGAVEHPLPGLGVEFVYACFSRTCLPEGGEVEFRAGLEDALGAALGAEHSGECLGGAMGREWVYVDLMLYDGGRSLETVVQVLAGRGLPKGTHIRWFTTDKKGKVVRV